MSASAPPSKQGNNLKAAPERLPKEQDPGTVPGVPPGSWHQNDPSPSSAAVSPSRCDLLLPVETAHPAGPVYPQPVRRDVRQAVQEQRFQADMHNVVIFTLLFLLLTQPVGGLVMAILVAGVSVAGASSVGLPASMP